MGLVAFNTYDFVKSLEEAGMDEKHAAAISAGILRAHEIADLATKGDLRELQAQTKADLQELRAQTKADLQELRAETKADLQELRAQTKADLQAIKGEMKLIKWMLGVTLAGVGSLIVAAIGLVIKAFFG